jgi:hypothetical protein
MAEKLITKYVSKRMLCLRVKDTSREVAWTTLTNIGAEVSRCSVILSGEFVVDGEIDDMGLIQIERLERDGWKWE